MRVEEIARITGLYINDVMNEMDEGKLQSKLVNLNYPEDVSSYDVSLDAFMRWYPNYYLACDRLPISANRPEWAVRRAYDLGYVKPYICHTCFGPFAD